jgi:hypothetical protein
MIWIHSELCPMAGCCEHGNEPSDPIKDGKVFDQLSDY